MIESGAELLERSKTLHRQGDVVAAIEVLEEAYRTFLQEQHALEATAVARTRAYQCVLDGEMTLATGWLGRARTLTSEHGDRVELAWLELFDAMADPDEARGDSRLDDVRRQARALGAHDLECDAIALAGQRQILRGQISGGMALLDEALTTVCVGEVSQIVVVEGACCLLLWACEITQDVDRAERWLGRLDHLIVRRDQVSLRPVCLSYYGGILAAAGRWAEAEAALDDALAGLRAGYAFARTNALVRLADLRQRQGRYEAAVQLLVGMEEHADAAVPLTSVHLATGRLALADERLSRALPDAEGMHRARLLGLEVDVALAGGMVQRARRAAAELRSVADASPEGSGYLTGLAALAEGQVLAVEGDVAGAASALRRAVAAFAGARTPLELAGARVELAGLLAEDAPEVSEVEARRALRTGERLGAARLVDRAAGVLRALGHPIRLGERGRTGLTGREKEVLGLIGVGLTNPEIAERLVISPKTVEHHVSRILAKLGLRNRTEAAAYVVRTAASDDK